MFRYGSRNLSLRGEAVGVMFTQAYIHPDLEVEQMLLLFSIIIMGNSPIRAHHQ